MLELCHEKLAEGGYLLWYTQRGDRTYANRMLPRYRLGDGYFVGKSAKFKTFYREFTVAEIDQLLEASGFELIRPISASPRNQARLYRRLDVSPIQDVIDSSAIDAARIVDERIPLPDKVKPRVIATPRLITRGHPDPPQLRVESLYAEQLTRIPVGSKAASRYQRHVKAIIELVFGDELRDIRPEVGMFSGRKRLDIIARNKSQGGFFRSLKDDGRWCPYIVIECKNYRDEPGNPEFDQLASRLGRKLGLVGLLTYRSARDRRRVIARCGDLLDNDEKLVIPLSDSDLTEILRLRQAGNNRGIESYLDGIVEEIVRQ